jgi:hemerythrin
VKDIIWNNALSVEVDEIDEDHRRLVDLYNILKESVVQGDSADYIEAVLDELVSCTVWHFKHEERLMLKYGYDGMADHKQEHEELVETAKEVQQKIIKGKKRVSGEEVEFLEHWLTGHILSADMALGSFLNEVM